MNLIRFEPFASLEGIFGRMPALPRWAGLPEFNGETRYEWSPSADISETDREFLIRAELPAVKKEDVHVNVRDGMLSVSGERQQEKEEKGKRFHRVERAYGRFERRMTLPADVDPTKVAAEFKDGLLQVHLPKSAVKTPPSVEVKVS